MEKFKIGSKVVKFNGEKWSNGNLFQTIEDITFHGYLNEMVAEFKECDTVTPLSELELYVEPKKSTDKEQLLNLLKTYTNIINNLADENIEKSKDIIKLAEENKEFYKELINCCNEIMELRQSNKTLKEENKIAKEKYEALRENFIDLDIRKIKLIIRDGI